MKLEEKILHLFLNKIKKYSKGKDVWTLEEFAEYRKWMVDYLKSHKARRYLIMKNSSKSNVEGFVDFFIKKYGLPIKPR